MWLHVYVLYMFETIQLVLYINLRLDSFPWLHIAIVLSIARISIQEWLFLVAHFYPSLQLDARKLRSEHRSSMICSASVTSEPWRHLCWGIGYGLGHFGRKLHGVCGTNGSGHWKQRVFCLGQSSRNHPSCNCANPNYSKICFLRAAKHAWWACEFHDIFRTQLAVPAGTLFSGACS